MLLKSCQSATWWLRLKFDPKVQEVGCSSSKTADGLKNYQMTILKPGNFKAGLDKALEKWIGGSNSVCAADGTG